MLSLGHVSVQSDAWTYATDIATMVAALAALVAITYSGVLSRRSENDLIRERRVEFELGLFAEISHQMAMTGPQHIGGHLRALIVDPASEELAVLRAWTDIMPTERGCERRNAIHAEEYGRATYEYDKQQKYVDRLREESTAEIADAIKRRVLPTRSARRSVRLFGRS